jgi:hypothetical protein
VDSMPRGTLRDILHDGGSPPATPLPGICAGPEALRHCLTTVLPNQFQVNYRFLASNTSPKGAPCQDFPSLNAIPGCSFIPVPYTLSHVSWSNLACDCAMIALRDVSRLLQPDTASVWGLLHLPLLRPATRQSSQSLSDRRLACSRPRPEAR